MPVSLTISTESAHIPSGLWGYLDWPLTLRVKTGGMEAEFSASLRQMFHAGYTTFFKEPGRGRPVSKKRIKKLSMKQETECAESVGGRRQQGSGSKSGHKGDGRVRGRYRIENKFRTAASIVVRLADLRKIRAECTGLEVPVFDILFREKGTLRPIDNWVLLPKTHWEQLANADAQADDDR